RRSYRARPSTPSTSSSNSRCRNCCMLCRAKASSVSQVGLDAATDSVLFFLTGGVSFCSGVDRARGSFGEPKVTPPFLVYTLSDVTSDQHITRVTVRDLSLTIPKAAIRVTLKRSADDGSSRLRTPCAAAAPRRSSVHVNAIYGPALLLVRGDGPCAGAELGAKSK